MMLISIGIAVILSLAVVQGEDGCPEHIDENYSILGCFENRKAKNLLHNDRNSIQWGSIEAYMRKLSCKCAKLAKDGNYAGFALHYYGECYGKTKEQLDKLLSKDHKAHRCVGDQQYTVCDLKKHGHCTGKDYAEAVYTFKTEQNNIDGGLGEWQPWTKCDKVCGDGLMHRERNCDNPIPSGKGNDCRKLGPLRETQPCKLKDCPIDGGYGPWKVGPCTRSCGGGTKTKVRECNTPSPAHGGRDCSHLGAEKEVEGCNPEPCPVNGGYGDWGDYGACSKSCGAGKKTRTRNCNNPVPKHGGNDCSKLGSSVETISCIVQPCQIGTWANGDGIGGSEEHIGSVANKEECVKKCLEKKRNGKPANGATVDAATQKSCYCEYGQTGRNSAKTWLNIFILPLNGGYGAWSAYGSCSKTCGGGIKTRTRNCDNPVPLRGGKDCSILGPSTQSTTCNTFDCPKFPVHWGNGDGIGGFEENIGKVSSPTECIAKCYSKKKNGKMANGATVDAATGKSCYCEYGQTGRNKAKSWRNTFIRPLHGGYGSWSGYGSCSKTCGRGTKTRTRKCNSPAPLLGGKDCSRIGPATESAPCNTFACPDFPVKWETGDGIGGSEENIGQVTNTAECLTKCYSRKKNGKLANGCTVDAATGRTCFCEYGQTSRNKALNWRNTFIRPLDGGYGSWGSYGSCSKTCGGGSKTRTRKCNNPAPLLGGKDCSRLGPASESVPCNTLACPAYPVSWSYGDGTGGSEENIGKVTNAAECVTKCFSRKRNGKLANGATVDAATGKTCYCEYGQTGRNNAKSWKNTFIRPLDGGYGSWGSYGSCSKTCGGGTKTRTRKCNNPAPLLGGKDCSRLGPASESVPCNTVACPAYPVSWSYGDGTGGSEENIGKVANAAECVTKCFSRKRNGKLANGATVDAATGKTCYCEYGQTGRNNAKSWKNTFIRPLDGGYGQWGSFGSCSRTCGGGKKTRTRQCNNPVPKLGGRDCSRIGPSSDSAACNTDPCPSFPANWHTGDGSGGSEENIGTVKNRNECYMKCFNRRRNGKLANGVTVDAAKGTSCYCEYGQTGRNGSNSWKNTFIRRS